MICKCGGILSVIAIELPSESLSKQNQLVSDRLCDVECLNCGEIYYSQPYDFGKNINAVRNNMKKIYKLIKNCFFYKKQFFNFVIKSRIESINEKIYSFNLYYKNKNCFMDFGEKSYDGHQIVSSDSGSVLTT